MKLKPTKYVEHPLSAEDKASIIESGFKIVDARFKPDEAESEKPKRKRKTKE